MSNSDTVPETVKSIRLLIVLGRFKEADEKTQVLIANELNPLIARGSAAQAVMDALSRLRFLASQGEIQDEHGELESALEKWNKAHTETPPDQDHP